MPEPILTFIHISDTHIPGEAQQVTEAVNPVVRAQALVQRINTLPFDIDFILHTGDVAYDRDSADYALAQEVFGALRQPIYYVAGNSDDPVALQKTLARRDTPILPFHYEFEIKGVQVIVIDSNMDTTADKPFLGFITEEQLTWLAERCAADDPRPLLIATHHNPQLGGIPWLDNVTGIQNTEAFHSALLPAKERLRGVFFGHIHQNLDLYRDGILYCSTLSTWIQFHGWPGQSDAILDPEDGPGFSVVTVYKNQTVIRRHRFSNE